MSMEFMDIDMHFNVSCI